VSSVAFGFLVDRYRSYNLPFIPMAALLLIGAWLWLKIDPGRALVPRQHPGMQAGMPVEPAAAAIGPP
jgi:hypothetical protein